MKWNCKRAAALALAFCLCLSLLPAAHAEEPVFTVSSPADLVRLARACTLDHYSAGLTVELIEDLDLASVSFAPIPVFRGTFHGNGHTIKGLSLTENGSVQGLFRYLEAGAVVQDLTVEGSLLPGGSRSTLGLLAGQNEGTIRNCAVSGTVAGDEDVGGLVGLNAAGGRLEQCVSQVSVSGTTNTGGIAGRNEGSITGCTNLGAVNTEDREGDAPTNTGGIAGRSSGALDSCINEGDVGYRHLGYNTGGIAGLQNGSVSNCRNHGTILGRKDIGGIVGQFEPYITLTYGEDPVQRLDESLTALSALMSQLSGQLNDSVQRASADAETINAAAGAIRDTAYNAASEGRTDADDALNDIYASAQSINDALSALLEHTDTFSAAAHDDIAAMNEQMKSLHEGLDAMAETMEDGLASAQDSITGTVDDVDSELDLILTEFDALEAEIARLESFVRTVTRIAAGGYDDPDAALEEIRAAADELSNLDLESHLSTIHTHLGYLTGSVVDLPGQLASVYTDAADELRDIRRDMDRAADELEARVDHLNDAAKTFSDGALGDLRIVNAEVDAIEGVLDRYSNTLGEKSQATLDAINEQMTVIQQQITALTSGASSTSGQVHGTASSILGQFDEVRQAVTDLASTPELTIDDLSEAGETAQPGDLFYCSNDGAVEGDVNVGGIAGAMATELGSDPEEDLDLSDLELLVDTHALLRAIVLGCSNTGDVTAKNGCAGGVAGRADSGAILSSTAVCSVEAGGAQAGGIAGLSSSVIRRCAAQCDVTGAGQVGGIAGEGYEIQDCRAMAALHSDGEQLGAIAGTASGTVSGNYFLSEDWAGIDGINYEDRAMPLDFAAFAALDGVPEEFLTFTVTFVAGGSVIRACTVEYGGSLNEADIPAVPAAEGQYGQWEDFDAQRILRSQRVEAVYRPLTTVLSSGGSRPVLLAEGTFTPDAALTAEPWEAAELELPAGYRLVSGVTYALTQDGSPVSGPVTMRILTDGAEGRVRAALVQDGAVELLDAEPDGSYLVTELPASGQLVVLAQQGPSLPVLLGAGAAAVLLLTVLLRRGKKRGPKTGAPAARSDPAGISAS